MKSLFQKNHFFKRITFSKESLFQWNNFSTYDNEMEKMNSEQSEHKNHNENKRLPNVMLTLHFDNEIQINIFHITQCYKN